ncbi:MAG: hypothetical protein ABFS22_13090 [Pseudomonadota bacterium]
MTRQTVQGPLQALSGHWVADHLISNQALERKDNMLIYNAYRNYGTGEQQLEKTPEISSFLLFLKVWRARRDDSALCTSPLRGHRLRRRCLALLCCAQLELPTAWFVVAGLDRFTYFINQSLAVLAQPMP